jgi:hypothetical protein
MDTGKLYRFKSPKALAALGAFCVPEPFGACLVVAAAIWWSCRKLFSRSRLTIPIPERLPDGDVRVEFGLESSAEPFKQT